MRIKPLQRTALHAAAERQGVMPHDLKRKTMLERGSLKLSCLVVCSSLVMGCASSVKYQIDQESLETTSRFELIDTRDTIQKTSEIMSLLITNCWYGIYRLGDDQIVPSRLVILSRALEDSLGPKLQGKKVIINRFEIFNNMQSLLRTASSSSIAGAIVVSRACTDAFALESNPSNASAVIVIVDIDIDGKKIKDKIVQTEPEVTAWKNDIPERVKRAVHGAVRKVVEAASK